MNVAVRPDNLNIISVCTGGGGLDLGVELAMPNARSVVLVEREAFAAGHLVSAMQEGLMAPAPIWSDVTTFRGRPWRGAVDGFIGGIPCQPHSLAGRREGSDDERDLWSDARRIIVQARPWFVLIENVRGMLSAKPGLDPGALRVWRDLRRLGFSVEAGLFTASEVGASHERERIFILGVADSDNEHGDGSGLFGTRRRGQSPDGGKQLADANGERLEGLGTDAGAQGRADARGPSGLCDGTTLEHATSERRGERRTEPELRCGRDSAASADGTVDDASSERRRAGRRDHRKDVRHIPDPAGQQYLGHPVRCGHDRRQDDPLGGSIQRATAQGANGDLVGPMDDASIARGRGLSVQSGRQVEAHPYSHRPSLFPPGPSDLRSWRLTLEDAPELEPAFRRVADGLASRLDTARVDRLRMLGNGVVSLQAAYAIRTLVTRLAEGGAPGAARLVRQLWDGVMSAQPTASLGSKDGTGGAA